jgi:hypothetical protein
MVSSQSLKRIMGLELIILFHKRFHQMLKHFKVRIRVRRTDQRRIEKKSKGVGEEYR